MKKRFLVAVATQWFLFALGWLVLIADSIKAAGFSAPANQASAASSPVRVGSDPSLEWPTLGALALLSLAFWAWSAHARNVEHHRHLDGPESHLPS